ncbi:MAG: vitamin K epoxide reductase family protein [Armatimonadota bacterium]|nr:vitamin K epoxide reductase family protein [Armatimonadota bacterium]MDR7460177.1 vitamin K epoxide reductase family protein [Armatimonadota bacterium]MDR7480739.1 vitamin K epoxide reductase family protein [Armatimonadota bacterium]MDR7488915.1 vitamin K epoxide reductase family protein [Armatimonadota bacterium]MDR7492342.1 vitamin K epoxide reductase family protein [Armatimonadota bacterium]
MTALSPTHATPPADAPAQGGVARPRRRQRRIALAALSVAGFLDALYMLAYHEGLIDRLVCPFFGEGCERVGRSPHAVHFGLPNALVGALGYAVMTTLAVALGDRPARQRPYRVLALGATAGAAAAASAVLTYEQPARVGAWCFWCLLSAALNAAILPLALAEVREARSARHALYP